MYLDDENLIKEGYFKISILGKSFFIKADEDILYLRKVVRIYSEFLDKSDSFFKTDDTLKKAIVTSFLLIDEMLKKDEKNALLSSEYDQFLGDKFSTWSSLLDKIEKMAPETYLEKKEVPLSSSVLI